jgi:hypothetical protein
MGVGVPEGDGVLLELVPGPMVIARPGVITRTGVSIGGKSQ